MTFDRPWDAVDAALLTHLVTDRVPESRQLEYKEALPGASDQEKREFLADVSAFANSAGGDLIYGVREQRDDKERPTGVPEAVVGLPGANLDREKLRLEQLLRDGIKPRIPGVRLKVVNRGAEPPCLVLRVPRSWAGPHMVTFGNLSRFYGRGSAGRYPLDVDEIRAGFVAAETAHQRVRAFLAERVATVEAGHSPIAVAGHPLLVFHVVPLAPWDGWGRFVEAPDTQRIQHLPLLLRGSRNDWRFNLEGFVVYVSGAPPAGQSYVQLFRSGAIEAVSGLPPLPDLIFDPKHGVVLGVSIESILIDAFSQYRVFLDRMGVDAPVALGLALLGARGLKLLPVGFPVFDRQEAFDRDVVIVPDTVAYDLAKPPDVLLRPLLDTLWNAAGWPGSPHDRGERWRGATS